MVDYRRQLRPLITFEILIVSKKFLMRDLCVISCGLTQMIDVVGVYLQEELDTLLARFVLALFASCLFHCCLKL